MPNAQHNPAINARRFAALLAGFDTGNGSEEEAAAKGRALRRMAADAGMRVVDVLELPEVRKAVDDQMRPARKDGRELREAVEYATSLRAELTERTRDVTRLADLMRQQEDVMDALRGEAAERTDHARNLAERLRREEERTAALSRELAASRAAPPPWVPAQPAPAAAPAGGAAIRIPGVDPGMALLTALLALMLLIASIAGGHFHEGGNGNGLGYGAQLSARGLHEGRAVRSLSNHRAVHHRLRRGGPSRRTRAIRGVPVPHVHVPVREAYGGQEH